MTSEEVKEIVRQYMGEMETETDKLRAKVVKHFAETMEIGDLMKFAVHEAAEVIEAYTMGNTEKMLHEVEEMAMIMCAVKKHLPEGMVSQIHDKAVHYYADKFGVK